MNCSGIWLTGIVCLMCVSIYKQYTNSAVFRNIILFFNKTTANHQQTNDLMTHAQITVITFAMWHITGTDRNEKKPIIFHNHEETEYRMRTTPFTFHHNYIMPKIHTAQKAS